MKVKRSEEEKQPKTSVNRTFLDWLKTISFIINNNKHE